MGLAAGDTFAGFRIVRRIGAGGMGEVYLVDHPRLPRREALKVLSAELTDKEEYRRRFQREADLAASLWHPHLVGLHDRGEAEGRLWISMDYIDGPDVAQLVRTRYPAGMPAAAAGEIIAAVASALDYAHGRGMIHRDIKPSNIFYSESDPTERRIALGDFGIAREVADSSGLTSTNLTVGTVDYAAPEQLSGREVDGRADQYGLAATAFHILTGVAPFRGSGPVAVISAHLSQPPPAVGQLRPELSNLNDVLKRGLAKEPADRFRSCGDFAQSLQALAVQIPTSSTRTVTHVNPAEVREASAPTRAARDWHPPSPEKLIQKVPKAVPASGNGPAAARQAKPAKAAAAPAKSVKPTVGKPVPAKSAKRAVGKPVPAKSAKRGPVAAGKAAQPKTPRPSVAKVASTAGTPRTSPRRNRFLTTIAIAGLVVGGVLAVIVISWLSKYTGANPDETSTQRSTPVSNIGANVLASNLRNRLESAGTPANSVTCESGLGTSVGSTARCDVVLDDGNSVTAVLSVTKFDSTVSYDTHPELTAAQLQKAVSRIAGAESSRCPAGVDGTVGASTQCAITKNGATRQSVVKVIKVDGVLIDLQLD